jgi:hypothetical protein
MARTTISFIFLIITNGQFRSIVSRTVIGKLLKPVSLLKKKQNPAF